MSIDVASLFDPHKLFHKAREVDPAECPECDINAKHSESIKNLIGQYGDWTLVPVAEFDLAFAETHKRWMEFGAIKTDDDGAPIVRHDKQKRMDLFVVAHHGEEVTLDQIMAETDAAQGTVYGLIREMPLMFRKSGMSRWRVTDPMRARAEALSSPPTLAAVDRGDSPALSVANDAANALRANVAPSKP